MWLVGTRRTGEAQDVILCVFRSRLHPDSDREALAACTLLAQTEGIIPALESAHAVAEVIKRAPQMKKSDVVIVNISGRGDKDVGILRENLSLA